MTFDQAQQQKELQLLKPAEFSGRRIKMGVYIVPQLHEDLIKYVKDFKDKNFDDELVKQYSSDNKFGLYLREIN